MMRPNFDDVGYFHAKFNLPRVGPWCDRSPEYHRVTAKDDAPGPREIDAETLGYRSRFLQEELDEFRAGMVDADLGQMADALVDLVYVALGTAHFLGLPWQELWDDVQRANMAKVRAQPDGSDSKRGSSWDVVKPEGWVPPDTWAVLERFGFKRPTGPEHFTEVVEIDESAFEDFSDDPMDQA